MSGANAVELVQTRRGPLAVRRRGSGPAIVLCHGNSCSSRSFTRQLHSALADRYQLLAIDLPGHGDSPPPADPERDYSLGGHAAALAALSAALGAEEAVFVGWSLGGHVLLEATELLPRAAGFLIFGAPPVASLRDFLAAAADDPSIQTAYEARCGDEQVRALVSLFVRPGHPPPPLFIEDFRRTDPRARALLGASAAAGRLRDEVQIIAELDRPLAVLHGAREQIVRRSHFDRLRMPTLWRGAVQELPDAGHAPHWESPDLFNQLLDEFATDCRSRR